jgi:hypothetical protein
VDHPSEETLKRFVAGKATSEEGRKIVAHLVKGCSACAAKLRAMIQPDPVARNAYEPALERFDEGMIEALDSSISPMQTLRTLLRLVPPAEVKKRE